MSAPMAEQRSPGSEPFGWTGRVADGPPRPAPPLPFTLAELRRAVPERCLESSLARSLGYLLFDLGVLAGLYLLSFHLESALAWVLLAFAQGTIFWSLFVIGHDCGHGSFSRYRRLNHFVGHLVHAPLLVPYHGWRSSHQRHHRFTGHADRDEGWHPLGERRYRTLPWTTRLARFRLTLLVFPLYLLRRTPGRGGSHFHPGSDLFRPRDRSEVLTSSILCGGMVALLVGLAVAFGPGLVVRSYLAPYLVFVCWVDLVTLLHHTTPDVPWYRGRQWSFLRGSLCTMDRRYGVFEWLHHHAGHHVAHHLFPQIPHYRLAEATRALRPVLGRHYRESREPVWSALRRAIRDCRFVPDAGEEVCFHADARGPKRG